VAALAIATELALTVDEATWPAWSAWLAARLGPRLTGPLLLAPRSPVERALRDAIVAIGPAARGGRAAVRAAAEQVERALAGARVRADDLAAALALAATPALFDRFVAAAAAADDPGRRDLWLESTGAFGPDLAARTAELALDRRFPPGAAAAGIAAMLARPAARAAAWRAIRERLPRLLPRLAGDADELLTAAGSLCHATARAEVAAAFTPVLPSLDDGPRLLDRALAAIDRCLARRAALGDLAAALR
jgi:hypothetical protein